MTYGGLDGGSAAPARQERTVNIDATLWWNIKHLLWQDLAEGSYHEQIGLPVTQFVHDVAQLLRLQDGDGMSQGYLFDGWRLEGCTASSGAVGLSDDAYYVMVLDEHVQGGDGKFWRPHEDDSRHRWQAFYCDGFALMVRSCPQVSILRMRYMTILTKQWQLAPALTAELRAAYQKQHLHPVIAQVLFNRGISAEQVREFLMAQDFRHINPYRLSGMQEAVYRLRQAIKGNELIAVYGDFDADGVTATALMVSFLRVLRPTSSLTFRTALTKVMA